MAQSSVTWTTGTYVYDGSGNMESIGGRPFVYDELGRLTYARVDATRGESYRYDGFGNIVTIQKDGQVVVSLGASPATNRMTDTTTNAWATYNADGSIASTVTGDTFTYDGVGMVKESKVAATRRFYLYTPSDERIASVRIQSNNTAGNREWTIRNPSGAVLTRFTQTPAGAWSWDEDYVYAAGQLVAAKVSGPEKVRHFFPDHLGTPRLITGNGGVELSRHTYYPFGEEVTSTASTERLKFTGHERDDATLDYMHARYYGPMWGRFLSVDPGPADLRRPGTWNRYTYGENNPVKNVDPDGRLTNPVTREVGRGAPILHRGGSTPGGGVGRVRTKQANVRSSADGHYHAARAGGRKHNGVDIVAPVGTPLVAAFSGTVVEIKHDGDLDSKGKPQKFGLAVVVQSKDGTTAVYAHLDSTGLEAGKKVKEGEEIGRAGRSGNVEKTQPAEEDHVHFQLYEKGAVSNPEEFFNDPEKQKKICDRPECK